MGAASNREHTGRWGADRIRDGDAVAGRGGGVREGLGIQGGGYPR